MDQMVWFRENWHEEVRGTKVLVSCVSDFVATCVFLVDQMVRKIIQLVVRVFMHLCICVKAN